MAYYELRLPTEGEMVKLAKLKPLKTDGFPSSDLPETFLDLSTDYIKGNEMLDVVDNGEGLEFMVQDASEVLLYFLK